MIIFLQCGSKMSSCYTYLGIAIKAAVRMGLHRRASRSVSPVEREMRCRVFWVLRKMDIYVSTMLGLPGSITDDDIDQELPLDIDDGAILESHGPLQTCPQATQMTATIAHIRLMAILKQIVTDLYPIKGVEQGQCARRRVYFVDQSKVRKIEASLRRWSDSLPETLKTPAVGPEQFTGHAISCPFLGCILIS
jgi:Fungal specific transcription factor domain